MTVPFRPTVLPQPEVSVLESALGTALETVPRAFAGARALIERDRENRRRQEEFESIQAQRAANLEATEQQNRSRLIEDAFREVVRGVVRTQQDGTLRDQPGPGAEVGSGAPGTIGQPAPGVDVTGGAPGVDLQVPDQIADVLSPIQLQPGVSFDPRAAGAREQALESEGRGQQADQVRDQLKALAEQMREQGREVEAGRIEQAIPRIMTRAQLGLDVSEAVERVISGPRNVPARIRFLKGNIPENRLPEGIDDLPPEAQVEELERVREELDLERALRARLNVERDIAEARRGPRGELSERQISLGTIDLLERQGIDPDQATQDQIQRARDQFVRIARAGAEPEGGRARVVEQTRAQLEQQVRRRIVALARQAQAQFAGDDERQNAIVSHMSQVTRTLSGKTPEELEAMLTRLTQAESFFTE